MTMVVDNIVEPTSDKLVTTFQYDDAGRQTVATDAAGHSTRTYYDQLGRVVKTAFDDGTVTETIYDHLGQRTGEVAQHTPAPGLDKSPLTTNYEYDSSGRLTAVILPPVEDPSNPTGPLVRPRYEYEYDIYGNQVVIRDNVVQELDGTVDYDHDDNNPGNDYRETFFSYDQFGR